LWLQRENQLLALTYDRLDKQTAAKLFPGRTWGAVQNRALRMGMKRVDGDRSSGYAPKNAKWSAGAKYLFYILLYAEALASARERRLDSNACRRLVDTALSLARCSIQAEGDRNDAVQTG
jgi:hypothetical protein